MIFSPFCPARRQERKTFLCVLVVFRLIKEVFLDDSEGGDKFSALTRILHADHYKTCCSYAPEQMFHIPLCQFVCFLVTPPWPGIPISTECPFLLTDYPSGCLRIGKDHYLSKLLTFAYGNGFLYLVQFGFNLTHCYTLHIQHDQLEVI